MNFFEHQDRARRQSRWLFIAFIVFTLLFIAAINVVVAFVMALQWPTSMGVKFSPLELWSTPTFWQQNAALLGMVSVITASVICLSSVGKTLSLRSGGGKVASDLGGILVEPDTRDPLRRRLYNVVEEISIASGTPVPAVYVLESEPGINAFAAGYTPADAAVAVTQGTLERLSRAELQGVIAHEFSHIFNGDMRINIRLIGVIFGIMVVAIIGRKFTHAARHNVSSSRNSGAGGIVLVGVMIMLVGYIGLFFSRWMKAAISRQREYLADASAVQFTRDPDGIAGALKKIAAYNHASYLRADPEEVSHMLFGAGSRFALFSTHPPIIERISRIEKGFDERQLEQVAKSLRKQEHREHEQAQRAEKEKAQKLNAKKRGGIFDIGELMQDIGNPDVERILAAALLATELPDPLKAAAHSLEWAPEVMFFCLLDGNKEIREKQLLVIAQQMGDISEAKVRHLITSNSTIKAEQRLPILEICYPTLRRRTANDIEKVLVTIDLLSSVDGQLDSFEYLLTRLMRQYLREARNPSQVQLHGKSEVADHIAELSTVLSIIASHGQHDKGAAGIQKAQKSYRSGMEAIGIMHTNLRFEDQWQKHLDHALKCLGQLSLREKDKVVQAIAHTVVEDGDVVTEEKEMIRVICGLLHVPLPILQKASIAKREDRQTKAR